jgi:hypothetical protein
MDVRDSQRRYWMELWEASFEVVRRRLAENDGEVAWRVIRSIIPPAFLNQELQRCLHLKWNYRTVNESAAARARLKTRPGKIPR